MQNVVHLNATTAKSKDTYAHMVKICNQAQDDITSLLPTTTYQQAKYMFTEDISTN